MAPIAAAAAIGATTLGFGCLMIPVAGIGLLFVIGIGVEIEKRRPKKRCDHEYQLDRLKKIIDVENVLERLDEFANNNENNFIFSKYKNGKFVYYTLLIRAICIILERSNRYSHGFRGDKKSNNKKSNNLNNTIKKFLEKKINKETLLKHVEYYQKNGCNLYKFPWIKSPFRPILVIAILLGLQIIDNSVTINGVVYTFESDFNDLLNKKYPPRN
jgi:hypothetical protein